MYSLLRIGDVIVSVYRVAWEWVVECHGEFGRIRTTPVEGQLELIENGCRVITDEEVGEDQWWVGLRPCRREREVYTMLTSLMNEVD